MPTMTDCVFIVYINAHVYHCVSDKTKYKQYSLISQTKTLHHALSLNIHT